jgi:hypothetical protein
MDALNEVVDEIEAEQERGIVPAFKVFRSILNQPNLVTINSVNATNLNQSAYGYSNFQVSLPRPIFDVASIQLVNANIPQATQNVPDTACAFWYYRLSDYSGFVPNGNNLYFNRLLPSYYKPENIANPSNYGFNRTFVSYPDIATQLALAGSNDLAYTNWNTSITASVTPVSATLYLPKFIPSDMSITYNSNFNRFQATGTNAFTPFATQVWASSNTYASNAVVYQVVYPGGISNPPLSNTYQSLVAANSNNSPSNSPTFWKQIYTDIVKPWNATIAYSTGALASTGTGPSDVIYRANYQNHNIPLTGSFASWSSAVIYQINDIVVSGGSNYTCVFPSSNNVPPNTTYWLPTTWNSSTTFPTGFITYDSGISNYYYSSRPTTNDQPSISTTGSWTLIGSNFWSSYIQSSSQANYNYLVAGFADPNIPLNQGRGVQQWNQYSLFESNALVQYNGINYQALNQNKGFVPFAIPASVPNWSSNTAYPAGVVVLSPYDSIYYQSSQPSSNKVPSLFSPFWTTEQWIVTSNTPPITGLYTFSGNFDMTEQFTAGGSNYLYRPFPALIPPQPYNSTPARILNSILGFSWNGAFSPSLLSTYPYRGVTIISQTAVDITNRLRPIPVYFAPVSSNTSLGGALTRSSTGTQTFTADGYANLNFTSIVSLYTTIAAASTMDTQQNTNLLATCPMNCVNLGVSFFEPKIANEIEVRGLELDTISISMFDEFGDPYFIGNNGVVTITLRMTYKDRLHIK